MRWTKLKKALFIAGLVLFLQPGFIACSVGRYSFNPFAGCATEEIVAVFRAELPAGSEFDFEEAMHDTVAGLQRLLIDEGFNRATVSRGGLDNIRISIRSRLVIRQGETVPGEFLRTLGEQVQIEFRYMGEVVVTGQNIIVARAAFNTANQDYVVELEFDEEGTERFSEVTQRASQEAAIPYNTIEIWTTAGGEQWLISSPTVQTHIPNGRAVISNRGSMQRAEELARQISAGRLPMFLTGLEMFIQ